MVQNIAEKFNPLRKAQLHRDTDRQTTDGRTDHAIRRT